MAQGLRVLHMLPTTGPLVLMCITMFQKDLWTWLALTVVGVMVPFAVALLATFNHVGADDALAGEGCEALEARLGDILFNPYVLLNAVFGGGGDTLVECLTNSKRPVAGPLMLLHVSSPPRPTVSPRDSDGS